MFERKKRNRVPKLNTTATADISFMLLIFFLVTSSMDSDKGLQRQLPPPQQEEVVTEIKVKERNVLRINIDAHDHLTCNDEPITHDALTERIRTFVANKERKEDLPEMSTREVNYFGLCEVSDRHILLLQVDRETSYDAYFQLQNAIVRAYNQLRDEIAQQQFHKSLTNCTPNERAAINMVYPQRISEESPTDIQLPTPNSSQPSVSTQKQKGGKR